MCLKTEIEKAIAQKAALDARIAKLEKLQTATAPIKNLLTELLADYSDEAPNDVATVWQEILAIGSKFNLSAQPLAADELRQWEAANAENQKLKQEVEKWSAAAAISEFAVRNLRSQLAQRESEFEAHTQSLLPDLQDNQSEAQCQQQLETWEAQAKPDSIPALTLWQPWASLVQQEIKRIETRSWSTNYRGPIAIHAAKKTVDISDYPHLFDLLPTGNEMPFGAVVAIANLIDCVEMTPELISQQSSTELMCGDWQPGRFAWILEIIRPVVPPAPATGGQKLWNWSGTSAATELKKLYQEAQAEVATEFEYLEDLSKLNAPEPEYEPDETNDTIDSILEAKGFFQPPDLEDYSDKYETYRGWDIYYGIPNGGIVSIGLYNVEYNQPWDVSTEYIQEIDPSFPESLADYDDIVKWTRALIDQVENLQAPGQLALDFSEPESEAVLTGAEYDAAVEEELALDDEEYETILITFQEQQWLVEVLNKFASYITILIQAKNRDEGFTAIVSMKDVEKSEFSLAKCAEQVLSERLTAQKQPNTDKAQQAIQETDTNPEVEKSEEVKYVPDFQQGDCVTWHGLPATVQDIRFNDEYTDFDYWLQSDNAENPWSSWTTGRNRSDLQKRLVSEPIAESANTETGTNFEAMGFTVQVFPQYAFAPADGGEGTLAGATFRFLNAEHTLVFDSSRTAAEIGDRTWKVCAYDLIQDYRDKEAIRLEKLANPHAKEEDKFVELVKISNAVGYLKRRDTGEILKGYAAFSGKNEEGEKLTFAKPRAEKWAEYLRANNEASEEGKNSQLLINDPRKSKRLVSDNPKQVFTYEITITGCDLGYLERLAQLDLSVPPGEPKTKKPSTVKSSVETAPTFRVIVNGVEMASGKNDEVLSRFEEELVELGDPGKASVSLMHGSEVVERYAVTDFHFVPAQDFDEQNPEYWTVHKPTKTNFRVYRSLESGLEWINSIYPYRPNLFATKEAAAADAVRRQLKAEKPE